MTLFSASRTCVFAHRGSTSWTSMPCNRAGVLRGAAEHFSASLNAWWLPLDPCDHPPPPGAISKPDSQWQTASGSFLCKVSRLDSPITPTTPTFFFFFILLYKCEVVDMCNKAFNCNTITQCDCALYTLYLSGFECFEEILLNYQLLWLVGCLLIVNGVILKLLRWGTNLSHGLLSSGHSYYHQGNAVIQYAKCKYLFQC